MDLHSSAACVRSAFRWLVGSFKTHMPLLQLKQVCTLVHF